MKRPLAHIGFSMAITLIVLNLVGYKYLVIILIGLAVILAASLVLSKFRKALSVPICLIGAVLACILFGVCYSANVEPQLNLDNKNCSCEFYIVDLPRKNGLKNIYTVKTESIYYNNAPQNIKLEIWTDEPLNVDSYQIIKGNLKFNSKSDNAFNSYGSWSDNIFLKAKLTDYQIKNEYIKSSNRYILKFRQNIIDTITQRVNGDSGALATALLIGDKSNLTNKALNNFKISGVTHIMAVSGMHLSVIVGILMFVLKKFKVSNFIRAIIVIPFVILYISLAGFSKSIIRAGIVMIILLIGEMFKRKSDSLNSLGLAVIILCLNPFSVCDVGALLSVLSMLSLITLYPVINNKIKQYRILCKPIIKQIVESVSISICVVLYTLPVLYGFFGYVSVASVISNVLLVPIASVAMVLSLLVYVTSPIPLVNNVIIWCADLVCKFILNITSKLASMPNAIIPFNDQFYVVLSSVFIIIGIAFITSRKANVKISLLISTLFIIISMFSPLTIKDNNDKLFVCKNNAVIIQCEDNVMVIGLNNYEDFYTVSNYLFVNNVKLDTLVLNNNNNEYNIKLAQRFNPSNLIIYADKLVLYDLPNANIINGCNNQFYFNDHILYNSLDESGNFYMVNIKDMVITNSKFKTSDIQINNQYIKDNNGYIDLSTSNVLYCINNNSYTVRRID